MSETGEKPNTSSPPEPPSFRRYLWPLYQRLLKSGRPILVGPWRGEVGFEALYWLPFLSQFRKGLPNDRLIPITRGGMGVLYDTPTYVELYAMRDPHDIRVENRLQHAKTGMLKQMRVSTFDKAVIKDAAESLKLSKYHVLHPSWMFQALSPFWDGYRGVNWLRPRVDFPVLSPPPLPEGLTLPEKFVAVRFYARATFPMSPLTADAARETIKILAKEQPVIVLNSGLFTDDHIDFEPKGLANVQKLSDLCTLTADNNLAVQAAALARSLGFVGTYGGLAQLALRFGKPTVSLYTDWGGTAWPHRTLSEMLATSQGIPFHVERLADLPLLQSVLPRFVRQ